MYLTYTGGVSFFTPFSLPQEVEKKKVSEYYAFPETVNYTHKHTDWEKLEIFFLKRSWYVRAFPNANGHMDYSRLKRSNVYIYVTIDHK